MKNKTISDFVAASMNAVMNSPQHKALFNNVYKYASAEDSSSSMDQNDAKSKKHSKKCEDCGEDLDNCCCSMSDDVPLPADDNFSAEEMSTKAAFDVAVDSLLTASAALDSVGMEHGSTLSLKLASLVAEAKKKMTSKEKEELLARLQKGKKGKKPQSAKSTGTSSSKSTSKSTGTSSSKSTSKSASYNYKLAQFDPTKLGPGDLVPGRDPVFDPEDPYGYHDDTKDPFFYQSMVERGLKSHPVVDVEDLPNAPSISSKKPTLTSEDRSAIISLDPKEVSTYIKLRDLMSTPALSFDVNVLMNPTNLSMFNNFLRATGVSSELLDPKLAAASEHNVKVIQKALDYFQTRFGKTTTVQDLMDTINMYKNEWDLRQTRIEERATPATTDIGRSRF